MSRENEHTHHLAEEATRRRWTYSPDGADLRLDQRWRWPLNVEHPFQWNGHGSGLDRRVPVRDVLSGATPGGQSFWSFWYPITASPWRHGRFVTRSVAFICKNQTLPTASVASRERVDTRPYMARIEAVAEAKVHDERGYRRHGWPVGSDEFQRRFRVKAETRTAAEWLAAPPVQSRLLEVDPPVSITANGADVLAWSDWGGLHTGRPEDYDMPVIDGMLAILDTIGPPPEA